MDFEFVIPLKKEDLLNCNEGQYATKKIEFSVAWKKLGDCKKAVDAIGSPFILDYFDILYSIVYDPKAISFDQLQEVWDTVITSVVEILPSYVRDSVRNDISEKRKFVLNTFLMSVYIFSLFFRIYEEKLSFNADNLMVDKKSKPSKGKSKLSKYDIPWDWNNAKKTAFSRLSGMLQENIHSLWNPPFADDSFVNLVASCCYKVFESAEINQAKLKPLKDSVSQLLAVLVSQYNHAYTFLPQAVELLKKHEHSAPALASAIISMVNEYKCASLLPKVMQEVTEAVRGEEVPDLGKSVASLITSISETNAELLLPTVRILSRCLAFEPYALRNAVLIAFCDVLMKCFPSDTLSSEDKKVRDNLLKSLQNHLRDQSSYVRSKVLQLWARLAAGHVIPVDFFMPVLRTAKYRLTDSSSYVVKSAIQLFTVVLKENLYAGKFNLNDLNNQLKKANESLKNIQNKQVPSKDQTWILLEPDLVIQLNQVHRDGSAYNAQVNGVQEDDSQVPIGDTITIISQLLQKKHFIEAYSLLKIAEVRYPDALEIRCNMDRSDEVEYYIATLKKIFYTSASIYNPFAEEFEQNKLVITYLEDTIAFVLLISDAAKEIERPLFGQSTMEAGEAVEFFTTAYQFSAGDARRVVREMIVLIWSRVPGIKEAVAAAYNTLYLQSNQPTQKGKAIQAAHRLIKLLREVDSEQKSALGELIQMWLKEDLLNREFIQVLWEIYSNKLPQFKDEDCIGALMILNIIAEKNPLVVYLNLQVLIEYGLSKSNDLLILEYTCRMISNLSLHKVVDGKSTRLSHEHEVFRLGTTALMDLFRRAPVPGFLAFSTAFIDMVYKVCCNPLKVSDDLLENLYEIMKKEAENKIGEEETAGDKLLYPEKLLVPLISIFGQIIFRKWEYFERDVFNCFKKEEKFGASGGDSSEDEFESENLEAANDALSNSVNLICEQCLFMENSLDAYLRALVEKLSFGRQVSPSLQTALVVALAKLMMISNTFCDNNIQILVTLMEKSPAEEVRAAAVLGFGDLVMRFPNILDPWTSHLYARLRDCSFEVRNHTVLTLSYLITREMIKVRGQISELCLCLEDPQPSIANRVKLLLKNLSLKGNTLYNVIPDIISHLSDPSRQISVPEFSRIMKYILGLLGKERQNDLLVEKLCTRLRETDNETQWAQFSFCLSQLSYSEKSLRRLVESLPSLKNCLNMGSVYSALEGIFISASKAHFSKPQLKEVALEGLSKLEELLTIKDDAVKVSPKEGSGSSEELFVEPATPRRVPGSVRKNTASRRTPRTTRPRL